MKKLHAFCVLVLSLWALAAGSTGCAEKSAVLCCLRQEDVASVASVEFTVHSPYYGKSNVSQVQIDRRDDPELIEEIAALLNDYRYSAFTEDPNGPQAVEELEKKSQGQKSLYISFYIHRYEDPVLEAYVNFSTGTLILFASPTAEPGLYRTVWPQQLDRLQEIYRQRSPVENQETDLGIGL